MKNAKLKIIFISCLLFVGMFFTSSANADVSTDNALNFLKSKQDATGRITTGFSAPSQWSAIAFAINGIDVATVKNPDVSLMDFLRTDIPASPSAATDWEPRILAIVAIGEDPTTFGGVDYVSHLETFYEDKQIGDICSLNDDIFGLLALLASGSSANEQIKKDTLDFLITHQDATDGGFGFSAPGCAWYATSADMTAAAIQALVAARDVGMTSNDLDNAIAKAKAYLLSNQDADGGFGYYGSSDTDTTGWVVQAFNVLGMKESEEVTKARNYLLSQKSVTDGGVTAFDWGTSTFVSNATTTAQSVIALSGKGWILSIFDPSTVASISATLTVQPEADPTLAETPTPTPTPSSSSSTPTNTPIPHAKAVETATPTAQPEADSTSAETVTQVPQELASPTPTGTVLGFSDTQRETSTQKNRNAFIIASMFAGFGVLFLFIYFVKPFIIKKLF